MGFIYVMAAAFLFLVVYNLITIIAVFRNRLGPLKFKVKLSLVLNIIYCALMFLPIIHGANTYEKTWYILFWVLNIWYAVILWPKRK